MWPNMGVPPSPGVEIDRDIKRPQVQIQIQIKIQTQIRKIHSKAPGKALTVKLGQYKLETMLEL